MSDSTILSALRTQAWERAKGELQAVLQTYYSPADGDKFHDMNQAINSFVSDVEGRALQE